MALVETIEIDGEEREIADAVARGQCAANAEGITELNSNLSQLEFGKVAGGKNLWSLKSSYTTTINTWALDRIEMSLKAGTYRLSCSNNTSAEFIFANNSNTDVDAVHVYQNATFTLSKDTKYVYLWINTGTVSDIQIEKGTTATPYEPYIPSVKMLAEEVSAQNESLSNLSYGELSGSANIFNTNNLSKETSNGITFTPKYDRNGLLEYINVNGTATEQARYYFENGITFPFDVTLNFNGLQGTDGVYCYGSFGNYFGGKKNVSSETSFGTFFLVVNNGKTVNNQKIYPMICDSKNIVDDYEPYIMSNSQLTNANESLKNDLSEKLKVISISLEGVTVKAQSIATVELPQEYQDAGYIIASILTASEYSVQPYEISGNSIQIKNKDSSDMMFVPTAAVKVLIAKIG